MVAELGEEESGDVLNGRVPRRQRPFTEDLLVTPQALSGGIGQPERMIVVTKEGAQGHLLGFAIEEGLPPAPEPALGDPRLATVTIRVLGDGRCPGRLLHGAYGLLHRAIHFL